MTTLTTKTPSRNLPVQPPTIQKEVETVAKLRDDHDGLGHQLNTVNLEEYPMSHCMNVVCKIVVECRFSSCLSRIKDSVLV